MSYVETRKGVYDTRPAIYPMATQRSLEDVLANAPELEQAFIMELYLKYGLRVIGHKSRLTLDDSCNYYSLEKDGVCVGSAHVTKKSVAKKGSAIDDYSVPTFVPEYRFWTRLSTKDRGRDRNTWTSVSLRNLMKAISFMGDGNAVSKVFLDSGIRKPLSMAARKLGEVHDCKPWDSEVNAYEYGSDVFHALVKLYGGADKRGFDAGVINSINDALIKVTACDAAAIKFKESVVGAFRSDFYVALQYKNYFSLGKIKMVPVVESQPYFSNDVLSVAGWAYGVADERVVLTQPMTMYSSLGEVAESDPDFVSAITMARIDADGDASGLLLPVWDKYYEASGVATYYARQVSSSEPMVIVVAPYVHKVAND